MVVYLTGIAINIGILMIAVLGLSLMTGFTGLFSFGQAGFMSIGAYAAAISIIHFGVPFYLAIVIGGASATIVAYFVGRLTLNLKGDYFCIATLGFGESVRLILENIPFVGGAMGLPGIPRQTTLGLVIFINVIAVIILAGLIRSRQGRNMVAIREEELASKAIGINVFRHKTLSFVIAAFYAGVAGALQAAYIGFLQPAMFGLINSIELTIMVIFGGIGSITGSIIGTTLLVSLPEILRGFDQWRLVMYGALVVLIIVLRPEGLMGGKEFSLKFFKRFGKRRAQ